MGEDWQSPIKIEVQEPGSDVSLPAIMSPVAELSAPVAALPASVAEQIPHSIPADGDQDGFDVDERELLQLYRRIPPPDLRAFALNRSKERMTSDITRRVKDDGIFDSFRRTWLKDLETKPQFQNLIRRVEIRCSEFLKTVKWSTDLNKTQLRDKLQHFIEGLSFVDTGIKDLLQEINTGVYSNPIPIQRFEDAVSRIVGDKVKQCIEGAMPDFPRLRRMHGETDYLPPAPPITVPFQYQPEPRFNPNALQPEEIRRKDLRNSRSKSPDLVDMEISSPEGSGMDLDDVPLPQSVDVPDTGAEEYHGRLSVPPPPPAPTTEGRDDRVEGALVLLMLASGKEWGSSPPASVEDVPSILAEDTSSQSESGDVASDAVKHPDTESRITVMAAQPMDDASTESVKSTPLSDMLVKTEPVSAESSPGHGESVEDDMKPEKEIISDKKPIPNLDALFDPIESGSEDEKPLKEPKVSGKSEPKGASEKPKEGSRTQSSSSKTTVAPSASSTARSAGASKVRPKHTAVRPPVEQFQSRITKISTEKLPISQAKSLKRPASKSNPPKAVRVTPSSAPKKAEPKPAPVKERPKFVPVITDFSLDPAFRNDNAGKNTDKVDTSREEPEPQKVQPPVGKSEKRSADEMESEEGPVTSGSTVSEARPTRQRKTNSKYCNDAFVSVPPLPKRTPTARKSRGSDAHYPGTDLGEESASSPGNANVPDSNAVEARQNNKKRRK